MENGKPHLPPYWLDTVCLKLPSRHEVEEVRYLCQSITNKIAQNISGAIRFPGGSEVFTELINVSLPHADDFTSEEVSKILECCNERIAALSENISRGVDILAIKVCLFLKYIRYCTLFGFYYSSLEVDTDRKGLCCNVSNHNSM